MRFFKINLNLIIYIETKAMKQRSKFSPLTRKKEKLEVGFERLTEFAIKLPIQSRTLTSSCSSKYQTTSSHGTIPYGNQWSRRRREVACLWDRRPSAERILHASRSCISSKPLISHVKFVIFGVQNS